MGRCKEIVEGVEKNEEVREDVEDKMGRGRKE